ncbi:hypothetical protein NECAME_11692 [Necator americanus]|uniref:Uncharacterized protein n=1 Tax=Necator americanus TaxID=51031 RepID=W2T5E8_NECAM|nr:hypothetical protein NECAME_11692 [Necator americanus]ETN76411.1 hypothetical protein NECAME_11692 [Necator americanus]
MYIEKYQGMSFIPFCIPADEALDALLVEQLHMHNIVTLVGVPKPTRPKTQWFCIVDEQKHSPGKNSDPEESFSSVAPSMDSYSRVFAIAFRTHFLTALTWAVLHINK